MTVCLRPSSLSEVPQKCSRIGTLRLDILCCIYTSSSWIILRHQERPWPIDNPQSSLLPWNRYPSPSSPSSTFLPLYLPKYQPKNKGTCLWIPLYPILSISSTPYWGPHYGCSMGPPSCGSRISVLRTTLGLFCWPPWLATYHWLGKLGMPS